MAVTKIKPIRGTVNKALAYILDPQKTDDALYVSSYGCAASDAAAKEFEWTRNLAVQQGMQMPKVIARHLIQSFDVGEVTPEQAHEIGKQFADEWLKGKYEYVIATHIDKGHCHNHIIFNAVNYVDFHAYRSNKQTYRQMRLLSDEICKEHGLSVIPPSQSKGMSYKEYTEAKRGTSWKQKLKQTIDRCVITAKDYDEFLKMMQDAGYEIKTGKYISFRAEGQERFTRAKTIGENYTEERIKERIQGRNPRKRQMQSGRKGISLIGDIQERIIVLRRDDATVNGLLEFLFPARASLGFGVLLVAHALALRRRDHRQSMFLANFITELPHLTVGLLVAPVRMEVHIVDGVEDNMIMTMPLVYVGGDHIFVLAFEPFVSKLFADLMSLFRCNFTHIK